MIRRLAYALNAIFKFGARLVAVDPAFWKWDICGGKSCIVMHSTQSIADVGKLSEFPSPH